MRITDKLGRFGFPLALVVVGGVVSVSVAAGFAALFLPFFVLLALLYKSVTSAVVGVWARMKWGRPVPSLASRSTRNAREAEVRGELEPRL